MFYTRNEEEPYKVNISGTPRAFNFGTLRKFSLPWRCGQNISIHNFTIATYPEETHHVYTHTFVSLGEPDSDNIPLHAKRETEEINSKVEEPRCSKTWIPSDLLMLKCRRFCKSECGNAFTVMTYNIWNTNTYSNNDAKYPARFKLLKKVKNLINSTHDTSKCL